MYKLTTINKSVNSIKLLHYMTIDLQIQTSILDIRIHILLLFKKQKQILNIKKSMLM